MRSHPQALRVFQSLDNDHLISLVRAVLDQTDATQNAELCRSVEIPPFPSNEESQQYLIELLMRLEYHAIRYSRGMRKFLAWLENEQHRGHKQTRPPKVT